MHVVHNSTLIKTDNFYSPYNQDFYRQYTYTSLEGPVSTIRLLRLVVDDATLGNDTPIRCQLLDPIPLSEIDGKFSTISYCAGNPEHTEEVLVNDILFNAFARLGHALRQARWFWAENRLGDECLLWADQICINQSDLAERSHQVTLMGNIYGAAEQGFISLTKDGDPSGTVAWRKDFLDFRFKDDEGSREDYAEETKLHPRMIAYFRSVLKSPYWSRAWVRQEYFRSRRTRILAAFECLEDSSLRQLLDIFHDRDARGTYMFVAFHCFNERDGLPMCQVCQELPSILVSEMEPMEDFLATQAMYKNKQDDPEFNILSLLSMTKRCEASDPRDLIYAFMGLTERNLGLSPDYSPGTTIQDVLHRLATNALMNLQDLSFLRLTDSSSRPIRYPDLPSWVPENFELWDSQLVKTTKHSNLREPIIEFGSDECGKKCRVLLLRGIQVDQAKWYQRPWYYPWLDPALETDSIWWIYGSRDLYLLRPKVLGIPDYLLIGVFKPERVYRSPVFPRSKGSKRLKNCFDNIDENQYIGWAHDNDPRVERIRIV